MQIPNGWQPRDYQRNLWKYLEGGGKRAVAVWHRRAGKDVNILNYTATQLMERPATYWHMLPKANQARKAIWNALNPHTGVRLIDQAFPKEIRENTQDHEMMIRTKTGSTWQVVGSDNFNQLVGSPPLGVVFSEWSLCDPAAWDYIRPILAENGGWAIFIYTSRGKNHGHRLYKMAKKDPNWYAELLTVDDTKAISVEILQQEKKELIELKGEDEGLALYEQEYNCSFDAALPGSYYGNWLIKAEKEGRIGKVPYIPNKPVYTCCDWGIGDSAAFWFFQVIDREWRFIDYYEHDGKAIQHYKKIMESKPYTYAKHIGPHDLRNRQATAAEANGDAKQLVQVAKEIGLQFEVAPKVSLEAGIQAVRDILPLCHFDAEKCERGLDCLSSYRREYNEKLQRFEDNPVHDWASHGADALRYGAVGFKPAIQMGNWGVPRVSIA